MIYSYLKNQAWKIGVILSEADWLFFLQSAWFPSITAPWWAVFLPWKHRGFVMHFCPPLTVKSYKKFFLFAVAGTGWDLETHPGGEQSIRNAQQGLGKREIPQAKISGTSLHQNPNTILHKWKLLEWIWLLKNPQTTPKTNNMPQNSVIWAPNCNYFH